MRPLTILHAATHGFNIGDGALVRGIHNTLKEDLNRPCNFVPLDVLKNKLQRNRDMLPKSRWIELQQQVDLVLVGGGGMIEGGKGNYLSGINFSFHLDLLEKSKVPWAFYALGQNQFRNTHFFHKARLKQLLSICQRRNFLFSVRNDLSKARLENQFGPLPFVQTVPDPGMFVDTSTRSLSEFASDRFNVVLQLAGDRLDSRLGGPLQRGLGRLRGKDPLRALATALQNVNRQHPLHLILCPHLTADLGVLARFASYLDPYFERAHCTVSPVLTGAENAAEFFELYRKADLVLGMRGHSSICAVGLGTPFIGLSTHDKVGGFLAETGLGQFNVDLREDGHLRLVEPLVRRILANPQPVRSQLAEVGRTARAQVRQFNQQIGCLVDGRETNGRQ